MKARILKSIITWSEMEQQTTQAKEVSVLTMWRIKASKVSPKNHSNMAKIVLGVKIRIRKNVKNLETNLVFSNFGINMYNFDLK